MVSIIIPHYNRPALLKEAVHSVINQTSKDWELIIVDDGSDEKVLAAIKLLEDSKGQIKILKRQSEYKGPSACRNEGVAVSKGKYLVFLDSDDGLAPYCVEQRSYLMDENKDLHMGVFLMQEFTSKIGDSENSYNNSSTNENRINSFLEGNNPWTVTCPIWRKDFFIKTGGFDESFFYMEDPELHIRALLQDEILYRTFYDYPADCYYRINFHDDTKKNFYENSIRYRILFYKKTANVILAKTGMATLYKKSFEHGVVKFFCNLLLSRMKDFPNLQNEFMQWAIKSGMLSALTRLKLKSLSAIYSSDNIFFRKLHLKGLAFKILTPKS